MTYRQTCKYSDAISPTEKFNALGEIISGSIRIYDKGGKTFERYTVVFMDRPHGHGKFFEALRMSERPYHANELAQHCTAMTGRRSGIRIDFEDLPADCQRFVLSVTNNGGKFIELDEEADNTALSQSEY